MLLTNPLEVPPLEPSPVGMKFPAADLSKGVKVGTTFKRRQEVMKAGVHNQLMQGIARDRSTNSFSIVLNGGYEDNVDDGDRIIVAGRGKGCSKRLMQYMRMVKGYRPRIMPGGQVGHQQWKGINEALRNTNQPVRVIRGCRGDPRYSPVLGFRYDGLYRLVWSVREVGQSGFEVCKFGLERILTAQDTGLPNHSYPRQKWRDPALIQTIQPSRTPATLTYLDNIQPSATRQELPIAWKTSETAELNPFRAIPLAHCKGTTYDAVRPPTTPAPNDIYDLLTHREDLRKLPKIPKISIKSRSSAKET